jgi:hypothetical protein
MGRFAYQTSVQDWRHSPGLHASFRLWWAKSSMNTLPDLSLTFALLEKMPLKSISPMSSPGSIQFSRYHFARYIAMEIHLGSLVDANSPLLVQKSLTMLLNGKSSEGGGFHFGFFCLLIRSPALPASSFFCLLGFCPHLARYFSSYPHHPHSLLFEIRPRGLRYSLRSLRDICC